MEGKWSKINFQFPEPLRIFPNLMRLWNAYSTSRKFWGEDFKEYRAWLAESVGVTEYELKTRLIHMGRKKATGFTGWVTYELKNGDAWKRVTCMLARFAEYSNVGGNRTRGFGAVRFVPKSGALKAG